MPSAPTPLLRIARPEAALFASDMHLDDAQPESADRFFERLDDRLAVALSKAGEHGAPALFLMGDLFEYWIGDDHEPAVAHSLAARLAAFTGAGGSAFLMHGNRDFLLDVPLPGRPDLAPFSSRCGATLLPDPAVVEIGGRRVVLAHGDALCTDDVRYQQWRALCRSEAWQQQFLAKPVAERLALAQGMRKQSVQAQAVTETLTDVNQAAVDDLMTRTAAPSLVHGHTHQPMLHRWPAPAKDDSGIDGERRRWVLSDWSAAPPRGDVLSLNTVMPEAAGA